MFRPKAVYHKEIDWLVVAERPEIIGSLNVEWHSEWFGVIRSGHFNAIVGFVIDGVSDLHNRFLPAECQLEVEVILNLVPYRRRSDAFMDRAREISAVVWPRFVRLC